MSKPSINAVPDVGFVSPVSMRIVVVFPAPLGPRKPNISPFLILKLKLLTAVILPKRLTKFETSSAFSKLKVNPFFIYSYSSCLVGSILRGYLFGIMYPAIALVNLPYHWRSQIIDEFCR
jgi:hypothetical protein